MSPERVHRKHHAQVPMGQCTRCHGQMMKCGRKIGFATPAGAQGLADIVNQAEGYTRPMVIYRCGWCWDYHVTSQVRTKRNRGRVEHRRRQWLISLRELAA